MTAQGAPAAALAAHARRCPVHDSCSTDETRQPSLYGGCWKSHVCQARCGVPAEVRWAGPSDSLHRTWLQRLTSNNLLRIPYMHPIVSAVVLDLVFVKLAKSDRIQIE